MRRVIGPVLSSDVRLICEHDKAKSDQDIPIPVRSHRVVELDQGSKTHAIGAWIRVRCEGDWIGAYYLPVRGARRRGTTASAGRWPGSRAGRGSWLRCRKRSRACGRPRPGKAPPPSCASAPSPVAAAAAAKIRVGGWRGRGVGAASAWACSLLGAARAPGQSCSSTTLDRLVLCMEKP